MMNRNRLTDEEIDGWWDIARAGTWSGSAGGAPPFAVNQQRRQTHHAKVPHIVAEALVIELGERVNVGLGYVNHLFSDTNLNQVIDRVRREMHPLAQDPNSG